MVELMTKAGETLTGTPWNCYPRPQMKPSGRVKFRV